MERVGDVVVVFSIKLMWAPTKLFSKVSLQNGFQLGSCLRRESGVVHSHLHTRLLGLQEKARHRAPSRWHSLWVIWHFTPCHAFRPSSRLDHHVDRDQSACLSYSDLCLAQICNNESKVITFQDCEQLSARQIRQVETIGLSANLTY